MKKSYLDQNEFRIQIDVKTINENEVICDLHTGIDTVEITLKHPDFVKLVVQSFFKKSSVEQKSKTLYTTEVFQSVPFILIN